MRALRLHEPGGIDGLRLEEIDVPSVGAGEALVRVHAAAITRDELGWFADRLPLIPSYELSGVVDGEAVFALAPFDRDGAAAEYAVVPTELLVPKPQTVGHVESSAIPLAALSAWQGLFDHGRLEKGQRVLINGAGGGVGHFAVQLARWRGADVVEAGERVDLVFDTAGGDALRRSTAFARQGGRVVSVAEEAPGATYFVVEHNRQQLIEIARLVDEGFVRPEIDSVFPLEDGRAAFERVMERGKRGKVVLRIAHD